MTPRLLTAETPRALLAPAEYRTWPICWEDRFRAQWPDGLLVDGETVHGLFAGLGPMAGHLHELLTPEGRALLLGLGRVVHARSAAAIRAHGGFDRIDGTGALARIVAAEWRGECEAWAVAWCADATGDDAD